MLERADTAEAIGLDRRASALLDQFPHDHTKDEESDQQALVIRPGTQFIGYPIEFYICLTRKSFLWSQVYEPPAEQIRPPIPEVGPVVPNGHSAQRPCGTCRRERPS